MLTVSSEMRSKTTSIERNLIFCDPFSMKNHKYRAKLDFLRAGPKKAGGLTRNYQKPPVSSVSLFFAAQEAKMSKNLVKTVLF